MAKIENDDVEELFPETRKMPVFWATLLAKEKIVINQGGTSSGKSQSIIRILFYLALSFKDLKIEIVASTIPKLVGDTLEIAHKIAKYNTIISNRIIQYHATTRTFFFDNGAVMIFKSYDTPNDAEGPRRDILYISEGRNFSWATVVQLLKRTRRKVYIDYNPVEAFWAHDHLINCPEVLMDNEDGTQRLVKEYPSVKVIRSWHIHNHFISQDLHNSIENIQDKEMWKAYARGLTSTISGMCYTNWKAIDEFPTVCEEVVWGMDLGYTNDPTVVVKIAINPKGLPYDYVFEELCYAPGIASGHIAKLMYEYGYKFGEPVYMDHDNNFQRELRQLRIVAVKANKGKGCIAARVLHLRSKRVAYTKKSHNIKAELMRYVFYVDRDGKIQNEPREGFDHAMNACEYGAFTHAIRKGLIKGWTNDEE